MRERINLLADSKTPFVFCVDYGLQEGFAYPLDALPSNIAVEIKGERHGEANSAKPPKITAKYPIEKELYAKKLKTLKERIRSGDVYMANITCQTAIGLEGSLEDVFCHSKAEFKLLVKGRFVVSSPEAFVRIEGGKIYTYPMKGTAVYDSSKSVQRLLESQKELAEHTMTVDLLRNDLSIVARRVSVDRFRYPLIIEANGEKLVQIVSEISGVLPRGYKLGDLLFSMLPAGSVTGTPKRKSLEIIEDIEGYDRGFFCGVFGYFDGQNLQSAVSIRFIEQTKEGYVYKSGGGVTIESDEEAEYDEMLKKVYLAF